MTKTQALTIAQQSNKQITRVNTTGSERNVTYKQVVDELRGQRCRVEEIGGSKVILKSSGIQFVIW